MMMCQCQTPQQTSVYVWLMGGTRFLQRSALQIRKTHKALHPKKNYQLKNSTTPYQQEHQEGITSIGELLLALCMSIQTAI